MQDYLTRFKEIDAVWASDDDVAVGMQKAIEQAQRSGAHHQGQREAALLPRLAVLSRHQPLRRAR